MRLFAVGVLCMLILSCSSQKTATKANGTSSPKDKITEYVSPDNKLKALVIAVDGKNGECRVEVRRTDGEILLSNGYCSEDGTHGRVVLVAKWTPDSNYFVYSTRGSDGQKHGNFSIDYYRRTGNTFRSLGDNLKGDITESGFEVGSPATVKVILAKGSGKPSQAEVNLDNVIHHDKKK